ncbi:hypothetical protein Trydic_g12687 [Trypoxylus dichotomus]
MNTARFSLWRRSGEEDEEAEEAATATVKADWGAFEKGRNEPPRHDLTDDDRFCSCVSGKHVPVDAIPRHQKHTNSLTVVCARRYICIRTIKSKKGVSWSCRNCNILSSVINDLRAAILSLRNDLAARKKSAGIDDKAFEELLTELGDRNNRKQNIIMFGVSVSDTQDANTRKSQELETVQAVLDALPSGMNTDPIEVHRIGSFVPDRRRPIKVKLFSSREAHTVLKHA